MRIYILCTQRKQYILLSDSAVLLIFRKGEKINHVNATSPQDNSIIIIIIIILPYLVRYSYEDTRIYQCAPQLCGIPRCSGVRTSKLPRGGVYRVYKIHTAFGYCTV